MDAGQPLGVSLAHVDVRERIRLAEIADRGGLNSIWVEDGDAFVALASIAHVVRHATLGTGIARAFARSPLTLATAAANLQSLTDGRFILGLGTGTKRQNLYQLGEEFDHPAPRVAELCEFLRQVWAYAEPGAFSFRGTFINVTLDGPALERARVEPPIPIYLAAVNDYMLRTAGRTFDGLAGHPCFSPEYLERAAAPKVKQGLDEARRGDAAFRLTSWVITSIDKDRGVARKRAAYQIGYYLSTRSYGKLLDWHGWSSQKQPIRNAFRAGDWDALAAAVTDEMIDTIAAAGTASDVIDRVERFQGVVTPILYSHAAGPARADAAANIRRILKTFGT